MNIRTQTAAELSPRLQREWKTIQAMVDIHCRRQHGQAAGDPCRECRELLVYARKRLSRCPFQSSKPTCGKCPIHCYKRDMRSRVKDVMRYSGPRMILHHPWLAFMHFLDGLRKTPSPLSPGHSRGGATEP